MGDGDATSQQANSDVKVISTTELFKGQRELRIDHNGESYRLRITARGRLILTK